MAWCIAQFVHRPIREVQRKFEYTQKPSVSRDLKKKNTERSNVPLCAQGLKLQEGKLEKRGTVAGHALVQVDCIISWRPMTQAS